MNEDELKEFRLWQRSRHETALDHAFAELEELVYEMKGYNITMPVRAFKILSNAVLLLKKEIDK